MARMPLGKTESGTLIKKSDRELQLEKENAELREEVEILSLPGGSRAQVKFGFMYVHRNEFHIDRMAKVLHVSQSGYYKWVQRNNAPLTEKEKEDIALRDRIFELFCQSRGSYGSRKAKPEDGQ